MKTKNHIKTNTLRSIKKAFPRFLSLIVMSLLGVLVFVGLGATSPDMLNTLDVYYDKTNTYDIKLVSSMGLIDDDINYLKNISNIKDIEPVYSKDILIKKEDKKFVLNVSSLPNKINNIELIDGTLPKNDNEIVVEENFLTKNNYKIGDVIKLNDEAFKEKEVTITGTILSPLYFNNTRIHQSRGATSIGTGVINYYSYIKESNFDLDYYQNIYLTVNNAKEKITSKTSYEKLIDDTIEEIKKIKTTGEDNRYSKIYNEVNEEILKNEKEANKEFANAKKELDNAKNKLSSAKKTLDKSKKQLDLFAKELNKAKKEIDYGEQELKLTLKKYNINIKELDSNLKELNNNIKKIESILPNLDKNSKEYKSYLSTLTELKKQETLLKTLKKSNDQLVSGKKAYTTNYNKYQSSIKEYQKGLNKYKTSLKKYNDGLKEYNDNLKEYNEEISNAKEKLNDIKHPTWYIYDRNDNNTYSSYIDQTKSIMNLAGLFPIVFYAVAILVSLISMNRMVEEDREEIGTLKSLGFTNKEIIYKYLLFSLIATLIGGTLGIILGLAIIPYLIFTIYRLLFILPNFQMGLNLSISLSGLIIAIICICGTTIYTANKILKEKPATLMRPKSPTSGKKIILEKIKWLWSRLKFSNKITIRNILRYKKRVFVTIFGITGCTALMLCGFGIKDSIVDITNMQYNNTFTFDATVYTKDLNPNKVKDIFTDSKIKETILAENISATYKETNINLLVTESNDSLSKIINLLDKDNNKIDLKPNKVVVTDKLADTYKIKKGDKITILDSDKNSYTFEVSNIAKNYLGHYIYLDKNTLAKTNNQYKPNIVYLNTEKLTPTEEDTLSKSLLDNSEIINVVFTKTLMESTKDMLDALNKVIAILIILAAALSFVVLYNLSNINITERKREIATLKVLGFYDQEVDKYITKENIIITIIGIIFGLIFGYFLTNATISTVEMENARFLRNISINSYIYVSIISIIFTIIVDFVTHFILKKIDMIESLKSVE